MHWRDESPSPILPVWPGGPGTAETRALAGQQAGAAQYPRISVSRAALEAVLNHLGRARVEQGGLLLGTAHATADAPGEQPGRIRLLAAVAAIDNDGDAVSLRMRSGVWTDANALLLRLQDAEPASRIIGWYHSHPNLGAFFSATDRHTQRAFFSHPYSVGWVIDPIRGEHAAFLGTDCLHVSLCLDD
ncbi:MAG: Mov34/MPN/PAD-1 family protein [Burkholderiaceae bacterium]